MLQMIVLTVSSVKRHWRTDDLIILAGAHALAICRNTIGSYYCSCQQGEAYLFRSSSYRKCRQCRKFRCYFLFRSKDCMMEHAADWGEGPWEVWTP